ncbi:hypothetical protein CDAR_123081 [Caerostris darwini]|uniref:Uncharacterized protein n=1 Tax=Caerostris darwini TaxID=1538125 RepID=A0AAV4X932_9ARAC|nr:hypothetical protein CDAR_123081 [Caerostris darwini]
MAFNMVCLQEGLWQIVDPKDTKRDKEREMRRKNQRLFAFLGECNIGKTKLAKSILSIPFYQRPPSPVARSSGHIVSDRLSRINTSDGSPSSGTIVHTSRPSAHGSASIRSTSVHTSRPTASGVSSGPSTSRGSSGQWISGFSCGPSTSRDSSGPSTSSVSSRRSTSVHTSRPTVSGVSSGPSTSRDSSGPSTSRVAAGPSTSRGSSGQWISGFSCGPSTSRDSSGPSTSGVSSRRSTSVHTSRPTVSGVSSGPSTSRVAAGPSTSRVAAGPSTSGLPSGPSSSRGSVGPSTSGFPSGPSTSRGSAGPSTSGFPSGPSTSGFPSGPSTSGFPSGPSTSRGSAGPSTSRGSAAVQPQPAIPYCFTQNINLQAYPELELDFTAEVSIRIVPSGNAEHCELDRLLYFGRQDFYNACHAVALCFSNTEPESFLKAATYWLEQHKRLWKKYKREYMPPFIFVGIRRSVTEVCEITSLTAWKASFDKKGSGYVECTLLEGKGVRSLFVALMRLSKYYPGPYHEREEILTHVTDFLRNLR